MSPTDRPNYESVDFRPEWFVSTRGARQRKHLQIGLIGLVGLGLGAFWLVANAQRAGLQTQANQLQQRLTAIDQQVQQVNQLQTQYEQLQTQARIHLKLARPVNFSQITGTLVALMPEAISLSEVFAQTQNLRDQTVSPEDPNKKTVTLRPVCDVEVEGRAPSNVEIADFVGALAESGLFRNVKMVQSRQVEQGRLVVRQFRLTMRVLLNVDYQPIDQLQATAAPAGEVSHAD